MHSDQDTFEESVSDSSTKVIEMFDSSTEENSFVESEVDDNEVEDDNKMEDDNEMEDDSVKWAGAPLHCAWTWLPLRKDKGNYHYLYQHCSY